MLFFYSYFNYKYFVLYLKKGISEEQIAQAQNEYSYVATDPSKGKTVLVKKSLFRAMFAFYMDEFYPLKKTFSEVLSKFPYVSIAVLKILSFTVLVLCRSDAQYRVFPRLVFLDWPTYGLH